MCGTMLMPATQLKQVSRGLSSYHAGLDLTAPYGSPVRAAAAGEVVFRGSYFGYGNMVDIRHEDGVVTRYGHLSSFAPGLMVGMLVGGGVQIGSVGTSGHAHGAHLHFEVRVNGRPTDPKPMLALADCRFNPQAPIDTIEQAQAPDNRRTVNPH
jgi:murein DD-endopeptidase MepM/ murein hydrolase activator NlpD